MKNITRKGKKICKAGLAALISLGVFQFSATIDNVEAAVEHKEMMFWNDASKTYLNPPVYAGNVQWQGNHVYWGQDGETPLKWCVLNTNEADLGKQNGVLLSTAGSIGDKILFNPLGSTDGKYMGSVLAGFVDDKMSATLSVKEQGATLLTTRKEDNYSVQSSEGNYWDDLLEKKWFAPTARMMVNTKYGYDADTYNDLSRRKEVSAYWLSSDNPGANSSPLPRVGLVDNAGAVVSSVVNSKNQKTTNARVIAATQLDPTAILFSSKAENGKVSNGVGASSLNPVGSASAMGDYKFTLKDATQSITVNSVYRDANDVITIRYDKKGTGTKVSAVVVDSTEESIISYGQLVDVEATDGKNKKAFINLPTNFEENGYKIKIFTEEYNGDKKTDYASELVEVVIPTTVTISNMILWGGENKTILNPVPYTVEKPWEGKYLYWGGDGETPLKWKILSTNENSLDHENALLLQGDSFLGTSKFNDSLKDKNNYMNSKLEKYIDAKKDAFLSPTEKRATLPSSKEAAAYNVLPNSRSEEYRDSFSEKEWFAPTMEMLRTQSYGFRATAEASLTRDMGAEGYWSSSYARELSGGEDKGGYVYGDGQLKKNNVDQESAALAATQISPNSILFASNAVGGKISNGVGEDALTTSTIAGDGQYKLTLRDNEQRVLVNSVSKIADNKATINYDKIGKGTKISAIVVDKEEKSIISYGHLADVAANDLKNETVDVKLPVGFEELGYKLKIFSELYNGDKKTDYASALVDMATPENITIPNVMLWNNVTTRDFNPSAYTEGSPWSGSHVYWGKDGSTPLKWKILSANEKKYGSTAGGVLLQGENLLGKTEFYPAGGGKTYHGSSLETHIDKKMETSLTTLEKDATLQSDRTGNGYPPGGAGDYTEVLAGQKWFAPTMDSLLAPRFGYADDAKDMKAREVKGAAYWTSAFSSGYSGDRVWFSNGSGKLNHGKSNQSFETIAATQLDPNSIVFISNAVGGKTSNALGENVVAPSSGVSSGEYKLTIRDKTQILKVKNVTRPQENKVSIVFDKEGLGTKVSALVLDSSEKEVITYGTIQDVATGTLTDQTMEVMIPSDFDQKGYKLKVFTEICNGDKESDYASVFEDVTNIGHAAVFDKNGGEMQFSNTLIRNAGEALGTLPVATKIGYTCDGWFTEKTGGLKVETTTLMPEDSVTYYAQWSINKYTAKFEAYPGNACEPITREYNEVIGTLPISVGVGYTFDGWFTRADGAGERVSEMTTMPAHDVVYYAKWINNQYTAIFDSNGGEEAEQTIIQKYNNDLGTLPLATKKGYSLTGWFTEKTGGSKVKTTTLMPLDGATYYAQWKINTYTAKFDGNKGSDGEDIEKDYDAELGALPTSIREGYTFMGWFTETSGGSEIKTTTKMPVDGATYYAQWKINEYTLTFDGNEGVSSTPNTIKKNYDEELGELPTATRDDYTFVGWYDAKTEGNKIETTSKIPGADATYFARWIINPYTAKFDGNKGSDGEDITINYQEELGTLPISTREGHTFDGWFTEKTGGSKVEATTKMPSGGTTYYAQWTINAYTATFNANGGIETDQSIAGDYDTLLGTLPTVTRTGYTFTGWFTKTSGGTEVTDATTMPGVNTTYYAHWKINEYTATFDANGGIEADQSITNEYDTDLGTLPTVTRIGYTFTGWFTEKTDGTKIESTTKVPAKAVTYYAQWTINEYTATFNANGGIEVDQSITNEYDTDLGTLPTVTRIGYTFTGWFTEKTDGTKIESTTKIPVNGATYYAQWTINEYTATFNANGGIEADRNIEKEYDTDLGTLPSVTRVGFTFTGWFTEASGGTEITTTTKMPVNGATYYAQWTINEYTVKFDGNKGSNGADVSKNYQEELGTLPISTREGHTFEGWFTEASGGTKITDKTKMPVNGGTYYAQWTINEYTVTFDGNKGVSSTPNTIKKNYDKELGELPTATRTGYTFMGWYDAKAAGNKIETTSKIPGNDATYFARWEIIQYTVKFDGNNGSNGANIKKDYEAELGALPTSVREGYTFMGWFTEKIGGTKIESTSKMPVGGATYYAQWTIIEYTASFDANGGVEATPATITKEFAAEWGTLPKTTRVGYQFKGWFTEASGGTEITATTKVPAKTVTYYAQWAINDYTMTSDEIHLSIAEASDLLQANKNRKGRAVVSAIEEKLIELSNIKVIENLHGEEMEIQGVAHTIEPMRGDYTATFTLEDNTAFEIVVNVLHYGTTDVANNETMHADDIKVDVSEVATLNAASIVKKSKAFAFDSVQRKEVAISDVNYTSVDANVGVYTATLSTTKGASITIDIQVQKSKVINDIDKEEMYANDILLSEEMVETLLYSGDMNAKLMELAQVVAYQKGKDVSIDIQVKSVTLEAIQGSYPVVFETQGGKTSLALSILVAQKGVENTVHEERVVANDFALSLDELKKRSGVDLIQKARAKIIKTTTGAPVETIVESKIEAKKGIYEVTFKSAKGSEIRVQARVFEGGASGNASADITNNIFANSFSISEEEVRVLEEEALLQRAAVSAYEKVSGAVAEVRVDVAQLQGKTQGTHVVTYTSGNASISVDVLVTKKGNTGTDLDSGDTIRIHANDFSIKAEEATSVSHADIIKLAQARAMNETTGEDFSITVEGKLEAKKGIYSIAFKTSADVRIDVNAEVIETPIPQPLPTPQQPSVDNGNKQATSNTSKQNTGANTGEKGKEKYDAKTTSNEDESNSKKEGDTSTKPRTATKEVKESTNTINVVDSAYTLVWALLYLCGYFVIRRKG